jgi:4'-phosphopantetheinyl transferase
MTPPLWLTRSSADVPAGDAWLGPRERAAQAGLTIDRRREDWRLGRWTAKVALAAALPAVAGEAGDAGLARLEVLAAEDGAPEPHVDGAPMPGVTLSISHRGGRSVAVVGDGPIGCDLELVEPRSAAFRQDWLAPAERAWAGEDPQRANLLWAAKEAAAKVRRAGLRLDVRDAVVRVFGAGSAGGAPQGEWRLFVVQWPDAPDAAGWWRIDDGWVTTIAAVPAPGRPRAAAVAAPAAA